MSDPYIARYQNISHQELFQALNAGDPRQILAVSDGWRSLSNRAHELSTTIANDLAALGNTWHSEAGIEFQRRLEAVAGFTYLLASEFSQVHGATSTMATHLSEAQGRADEPQPAGTSHMMQQAASSALSHAWGGPGLALIAGTVGAIQGHNQDEEEAAKAHQRMITLVAGLAAEYDQAADAGLSLDLAPPPDGLPGPLVGGFIGGIVGAIAGAMAAMSGNIAASHVSHVGTASVTTTIGHEPELGTGAVLHGSGLSGTGAVTDVEPLGGGSFVEQRAKPTVGEIGISSTALLGAGGLTATGLAATAASTRGAVTPGASLSTPTTGGAAANSAPRPGVGADSVLGREGDNPAGRGMGNTGRSMGTAAGGRGHGEEPDEHTSWLTEDNMDWGGEDAAPPILGERVDDGGDARRYPTSG